MLPDRERTKITMDTLTETYRGHLDIIGSMINANPELVPEGEKASELAMSIQIVGDNLERLLSSDSEEVERLKKENDTLKRKFEDQKEMTQDYYLALNAQNARLKDVLKGGTQDESPKKELLSWDQIKNKYASI